MAHSFFCVSFRVGCLLELSAWEKLTGKSVSHRNIFNYKRIRGEIMVVLAVIMSIAIWIIAEKENS